MDEIKKECYKSNINTLLMAYNQTNGRGRNNNTWVSNLGNLFLSIKLIFEKLDPSFITTPLIPLSLIKVFEPAPRIVILRLFFSSNIKKFSGLAIPATAKRL